MYGKNYEMPQNTCERYKLFIFHVMAFQKKHGINSKTEKEPKMKFFDFGGFKKMHMSPCEKYTLALI